MDEAKKGAVREAFEKVEKAEVRRLIVEKGIRRGRPQGRTRSGRSAIEMAYLPRAHGSALFTRGETQALVAATLGTKNDEQKIESFEGDVYRHFMLHYNFPLVLDRRGPALRLAGRRDIGHGALAERAIEAVLPPKEEFPYTIRIVSDILESNGSSSMATRLRRLAGADGCGRAAQVATWRASRWASSRKATRSGSSPTSWGAEDHYGDMDFKVAGTEKGEQYVYAGKLDPLVFAATQHLSPFTAVPLQDADDSGLRAREGEVL